MTLSVSIRHRFGSFTLDAEFETGPGVTALFGRSGAGKTTIAHAVAGLLRPNAGRVRIGERLVLDTGSGVFVPKHRRRIGYVFQDARLFDHLDVRGNLLFGRFFAPRQARRRAAAGEFGAIVELLGLDPLLDRQPRLLSGGERQRVAIGRALLSAPAALILDEPLASLDEERKAEILPYLERLREQQLPILHISHSIPEIVRLATNVVALSEGRVARAGPVAEVMSDPTLFPLMGRHEGGATIAATIRAHDGDDGLTELDSGAGPLVVPRVAAPVGTGVRVHVRARDVIIALARPDGLSALNVLPAIVTEIGATDAPFVDVRLQAGPDAILARITRRSLHVLRLEPGKAVFAVLKSAAIARRDLTILDPSPDR
jgi:molybdate transport system ATP-binding protein